MNQIRQLFAWTGNYRRDGLRVERDPDGGYAIKPAQGGTMSLCPCCKSLLASEQIARLVADQVFPLRDDDPQPPMAA